MIAGTDPPEFSDISELTGVTLPLNSSDRPVQQNNRFESCLDSCKHKASAACNALQVSDAYL